MSLQGTLDDFGIIEVLQIPYHGRKSCRMTLTGESGQAVLHYDRGQIVHASFQDRTGEDVIEEIIDWSKGSFEMGQDDQVSERTINRDLHTLLLLVVKARDEKRSSEQLQQNKGEKLARWLAEQLEAFRKSSGLAVYLSVINKSGETIAEAQDPEKAPAFVDEIKQLATEVVNVYPREGLRKAFYEDGAGMVSTVRINDAMILLAVSERDIPLGAITLGLNRLVTQVAQKYEGGV